MRSDRSFDIVVTTMVTLVVVLFIVAIYSVGEAAGTAQQEVLTDRALLQYKSQVRVARYYRAQIAEKDMRIEILEDALVEACR